MVRITRSVDFCCSLRYGCPDLSEEDNRRLFGAYARQHGHNYRLEVTLAGEPDPVTGMLIDIKELKELLQREVVDRFDHRDLNEDTPYFEKTPPTPENFAQVLHRIVAAALPPGWLHGLRLRQEPDVWVDVVGEEAGS